MLNVLVCYGRVRCRCRGATAILHYNNRDTTIPLEANDVLPDTIGAPEDTVPSCNVMGIELRCNQGTDFVLNRKRVKM